MVTKDSQGTIRFDVADGDEALEAMNEIMGGTDIGQLYVEEYLIAEKLADDVTKILKAAVRIAGSTQISVDDMARALSLLIKVKEIKPRNFKPSAPIEAPEPDERPRDKNGKVLSSSQLAWKSMREWAETHTAEECRRRAKEDAEFGNFMHKNLEREMNASRVSDSVEPIGQPQGKKATSELVAFAQKYTKEPFNNLRPRGGYVSLAGEQIPYQVFLQHVDAATAAGLI